MTAQELFDRMTATFGEASFPSSDQEAKQPWIEIIPELLPTVCRWLKEEESLFFDFLHAITGVDEGKGSHTLLVVYHLSSLIHEHQIVLKVRIPKPEQLEQATVTVPSVSEVWKAADWHEREAYDLVGIPFSNHPDLRRILLPQDWKGHPLRKDYETDDEYHGIQIDY